MKALHLLFHWRYGSYLCSTFWSATQSLPRAEVPPMKEEMQGFHLTPNLQIFISEKALLNHLYTSNRITPRTFLCGSSSL